MQARNRKKKWLGPIILLCLALVFLAGCGGGGKTGAGAGESASAPKGAEKPKEEKPKVNFPTKPITLICWSSPGSPVDVMSRQISKVGEKYLGQPINVLTKQGGGGADAVTYLLKQPKDGYTILAATASLAGLFNREGIPFKPDDIQPIIGVQADPYCIIVPGNSPFKSFQELLEYGQKNPGKVTISGPFAAGAHHVRFYQLQKIIKQKTGKAFDVTWVPFEGGSEAVANVMGGHSVAGHTNPGNIKAQVAAGKLKILSVSSEKRLDSFPDVPTYKEMGYDFVAYHWRGIVGPKGMPQEVVDILYQKLKQAIEDPEFQKYIKSVEMISWPVSPSEFDKEIREFTAATQEVVKAIEKK
ncbi:MAG: putative tricarboxylic transport rane protein [Clostridia bacterium]|nr:putative tricarboxylic transport rane protein [Clostridia bacterium]